MTPKKLTTYKTKLVDIRSELVGDVEKNLKSSKQEMTGQVPDVSDGAAQSYSKQLMMNLGQQEWEKLKLVDEALGKIKGEKFGLCEECKKTIPEPRLNIIPFTKYCVECLSKIEEEKALDKQNM